MPPKFQSSFIPKKPVSSSASGMTAMPRVSQRFYLGYRIEQMTSDLTQARTTLDPSLISELINLDKRIISTKTLVSSHQIITPLLVFLEESTPKTVRFTSLEYNHTDKGLELELKGEARGYTALALQADIFQRSRYFTNPNFSDLTLNTKGDVDFSFKGVVNPDLVAYDADPTVEDDTLEADLNNAVNTTIDPNLPQI